MISSWAIVVILGIMEFSATHAPLAHPPALSHTSMDVANIISIVIPENPDENINVDRLIDEFRQRLERIKKQTHASKIEHVPIAPVRVQPEMSREERRKALQLTHRALYGRTTVNPGGSRNWTREARRMEQSREGGRYVHSRSAANAYEGRVHRDYEENRSRNNLGSNNGEDYRRIGETRALLDHRDDTLRREDNSRQAEMIRREDAERQEDGIFFVEEETKKMARHLRDWGNQNWHDESHDEGRTYPGASSFNRQHKFNRLIRQRDTSNEIVQNVKSDKLERLTDMSVVNSPGEISANCPRINQRITSRFPTTRTSEGIDGTKRSVRDSRNFEKTDRQSAFVNYPKEYVINPGIIPNCNNAARNRTDQVPRDPRSMIHDPHSRNLPNFQSVEYGDTRKVFRDPDEESERSNVSAFENILSKNHDSYANNKNKKGKTKKKRRGRAYFKDQRSLALIRDQELGNSWNYDGRLDANFADTSPNFYEIFGERYSRPGISDDQTASGVLQPTVDNENKIADSRSPFDYRSAALPLRMQRATNITATSAGRVPKVFVDKNILERLKSLFKITPQSPVLSYKSVVLVYGNANRSHVLGNSEAITQEAEKSEFKSSPTSDDLMMNVPLYPSSKSAIRAV